LDNKETIYFDFIIKFGNIFILFLIGIIGYFIRRLFSTIDCKFKKQEKRQDKEELERKEDIKELKDVIKSTHIDIKESHKVIENIVNTNSTNIARFCEKLKTREEICKLNHK